MPRRPTVREILRGVVRRVTGVTAPKPKRVALGRGLSTIENETADMKYLQAELEKRPDVRSTQIEVDAIPHLHVHHVQPIDKSRIRRIAKQCGLQVEHTGPWIVVRKPGVDHWHIGHYLDGDRSHSLTVAHDNAEVVALPRKSKEQILSYLHKVLPHGEIIDV